MKNELREKLDHKSGQRAYRCPVCHYWHRTGTVLPIRNAVLRFSLISLTVLLITTQVRGEVVADKNPAEVRYGLLKNMTSRGYEVYSIKSKTIYFTHTATYVGVMRRCGEQRMLFQLLELGDKTAIRGFGVCYDNPNGDIEYYEERLMDDIIMDAIKAIPARFL